MYKPPLTQLTVKQQQQIDNKLHPRAVDGWTLTGSRRTPSGQHLRGNVKLTLTGGGWLWYPENTPLDEAFADADERGFDTAKVRRHTAAWVTGGAK
jgi:hypothetical protein